MEITNSLINIFTPKGFTGFLEFMVVLLQIIYVLFAFVLSKQVRLMNKSFNTPNAWVFTLTAFIHFWFSVFVVLLSIILL